MSSKIDFFGLDNPIFYDNSTKNKNKFTIICSLISISSFIICSIFKFYEYGIGFNTNYNVNSYTGDIKNENFNFNLDC